MTMKQLPFHYNDGGRKESGFKGIAGDCVTRAIAIASGLSYLQVYNDLHHKMKNDNKCKSSNSPRNGVLKKIYKPYIEQLGFIWVPVMKIGTGCTMHLNATELPPHKIIIARVSRHICAIVNGILEDTYDCSREGNRAVYGYWYKPEEY